MLRGASTASIPDSDEAFQVSSKNSLMAETERLFLRSGMKDNHDDA